RPWRSAFATRRRGGARERLARRRRGSGRPATGEQRGLRRGLPHHARAPAGGDVLKNELQLHEAVIKNDTDAVRRVLREPLDVNSRNNVREPPHPHPLSFYGRAPIHWAASRGNTDILEMLIGAKSDIEAKDKKQYTLLMCASRNNRLDVLDFLLDTLENPRLDVVDADGQTALFHAAAGGHTAAVRRLLEAGARIDKGHVEMVELLLRRDVDVSARDGDGNTALHAAAENQQTRCVQLLLERGCPPDPANK
ncbi:Ankyrin repeat and KH domain-containing protein mask, partial [Gryllus bimaculatus]